MSIIIIMSGYEMWKKKLQGERGLYYEEFFVYITERKFEVEIDLNNLYAVLQFSILPLPTTSIHSVNSSKEFFK